MTRNKLFKLLLSNNDDDLKLGLHMLVNEYPTKERLIEFFNNNENTVHWGEVQDGLSKNYIRLNKPRAQVIYRYKDIVLDTGCNGIFLCDCNRCIESQIEL